MKIALIPFYSALHPDFALEEVHHEIFGALRKRNEITLFHPGQTPPDDQDLTLVLIASGGTEGEFLRHFETMPRPVYLLTDGKHNSLAASLEISAWVRQQGEACEIIHGSGVEVTRRVEDIAAVEQAFRRFSTMTLGFVGRPSDWLIASNVDSPSLGSHWGIRTRDVELAELYERIDHADPARAEEVADTIAARSEQMVEPSRPVLVQAAAIYLGLKQLVTDFKLDALSLRCFDLIDRYRNTGCLALALLNDEGIMAGCEGDQQALVSVVAANAVTGEIPFQANPAGVDSNANRVDFAHCMIATRLVGQFRLRSHFESGMGVAIEGAYPTGPVTVLRLGHPDLSVGWYSQGIMEQQLVSDDRCRTQIRLHLDEDVRYFLDHPVANHHIIIPGHWKTRFAELFRRGGVHFVHSASAAEQSV